MAIETKERFVTNKKGEKTGVILNIDEYEEILEDLEDLRIIAERKDESTITLAELKKRLKKRWQSLK